MLPVYFFFLSEIVSLYLKLKDFLSEPDFLAACAKSWEDERSGQSRKAMCTERNRGWRPWFHTLHTNNSSTPTFTLQNPVKWKRCVSLKMARKFKKILPLVCLISAMPNSCASQLCVEFTAAITHTRRSSECKKTSLKLVFKCKESSENSQRSNWWRQIISRFSRLSWE